jgi:hypothetical protein
MTRTHPYDSGLEKNEANFVALSPLAFIERTAAIYPDRLDAHWSVWSPLVGANEPRPSGWVRLPDWRRSSGWRKAAACASAVRR